MYQLLRRMFVFLLVMLGCLPSVLAQSGALADGFYRIVSRKNNFPVLVQHHRLGYVSEHSGSSGQNDELSQYWKVKQVNGTYRIVNVGEQLAVQPLDRLNETFTVGTNAAHYYINGASGAGSAGYWVISTAEDFGGKTLWHNGGSGLVQNWEGVSTEANHWKFVPLTTEELKSVAKFNAAWPQLEQGFETLDRLRTGGLYRVKNAAQHYWTVDATAHNLKTTAQVSSSDLSTVWLVERNGDGFALRNASTGRFASSAEAGRSVSTGVGNNRLLLNFLQTTNGFFNVSGNADFTDGSCFTESADKNVVGGNARSFRTKADTVRKVTDTTFFANTAAEWQFEPVTDVSEADVKESVRRNSTGVYTPVEGKYYLVRNVAYPERVLTTRPASDNVVRGEVRNEREMGQLWQLEKVGDKWALRSVVNQKYVGNSAARTQSYTMTDTQATFTLKEMDKWLPYLAFVVHNGASLHCASSAGYNVVNWDETSTASFWQLEEVALDAAALNAYKQRLNEQAELTAHRDELNTQLQRYFADNACTQLRAPYASMSVDALKAALRAEQLPESLIDVAVRVRTDTWNGANAEANRYEKYFRIQPYQAYSHPQKWARDMKLMPTSFGQYSQLTNPTGITIPEKELALVFVGEEAPAGCALNAELVQGKNTTGDKLIALHKGLNVVYANDASHLYINYVMNDTALKYTQQPQISIHVEGGRANGYFDATKMQNQDWDNLENLKPYGFFTDDVIRLKSKHTIHSLSLRGVEEQQRNGNWNYNGQYKGITGVLSKWDWVHKIEQDFFKPEQFADRFNCLMFSTDASGLYAFPYGTFIGTVSTTFSYPEWVKGSGGDNGGNLWAVVHETGHHYQKLFNLSRCLESSNNLWSNIAVWKRGASVSRLDAPQKLFNRFNRHQTWFDMDLGDRTRMYWQLWLYYVELGHKPTFFRDLFAKFREQPIDSREAKSDYLRFARFCSEVAGEDLTEFFTFYGFFDKVGNNLPLKYNDGFYDKVYAPTTISVSQADIDDCKAAMAQFSKKAKNLMFIDERIRKTPATYEGHQPGETRWATIGGLNPGDSRVFGDVGQYTDFGTGTEPGTTAQPEAVRLEGRSLRVQGKGAVGYKVYNAQGQLVMVANRHAFTIPTELDLSQITVTVAGGDGGEVEIFKNGKIVDAYNQPLKFDNPAGLTVSTGTDHPMGKYVIRNYRMFDGKYYYADAQTRPTEGRSGAGEYIFVGGKNSGDYHIYSLATQRWATYSNVRDGRNMLSWTDDFAASQPWNIEHVQNGTTSYYNISPAGARAHAWNWHGGVGVTQNSMGFYSPDDANSHWELIPADALTEYLALVKHADSVLVRDAAKAVSTHSYHQAFRAHLATESQRTTATQADIDLLKSQLAAWDVWRTADSTLQADAASVQHIQPFLNDFKAKLAALTLASSTQGLEEAQGLIKAWHTWKKADEVLVRDAQKVKHSRPFYNAFTALVTSTQTANATQPDHVAALNQRLLTWPVWRGADSLVQIPPYNDPLNTKFRVPFSKLIEKDYTKEAQIDSLKDYGRYFRMLLSADSLLSLTNPGYPLRKFQADAGLEENYLQPAADVEAPDWSWKLYIDMMIDAWAVPANDHSITKDADAYYMPEDGKIYRLRGYLDNRYVTSEPAWSAHDGRTAEVSMTRRGDNATLWVLQKDANGNEYLASLTGKGYLSRMQNIGKGGLSNLPAALTFGTARLIRSGGNKQQKVGTLYIRNGGLTLVGWTNDDAVGGHGGSDTAPVWHDGGKTGSTSFYFDTVKEATFTVTTHAGSNGNFASLQLPFAVELPKGLTAYLVTAVTDKDGNANGDKELTLQAIGDSIVPANTPVVLSSAEAKTFQLRPTQWRAPLNTLLSGTNLRLAAADRNSTGLVYYGLTRDADTQEFLFRRIKEHVNIPGNRAFYTLPAASGSVRSLTFRFGASPSAVKAVKTDEKAAPLYDLSGRRINAAEAKGVVISGGKKIILR